MFGVNLIVEAFDVKPTCIVREGLRPPKLLSFKERCQLRQNNLRCHRSKNENSLLEVRLGTTEFSSHIIVDVLIKNQLSSRALHFNIKPNKNSNTVLFLKVHNDETTCSYFDASRCGCNRWVFIGTRAERGIEHCAGEVLDSLRNIVFRYWHYIFLMHRSAWISSWWSSWIICKF
jgi:hypothetical protein